MTARSAHLERLVLTAAIQWWKSKRPRGWSHKQHLDEPAASMSSTHDAALGFAIARVLEAKRGEPVYAISVSS